MDPVFNLPVLDLAIVLSNLKGLPAHKSRLFKRQVCLKLGVIEL